MTWLTKVYLVKAMVFPAVMCGCESWTVKKAESEQVKMLVAQSNLFCSPKDCSLQASLCMGFSRQK